MKALSVQQPWADFIMRGKDVENRSWSTNYRGPLLIHAGTTLRPGPWLRNAYGPNHEWELGGVVGIVDLVDCVQGHKSPWAQADSWHWVLANPRRVPFVKWKGTLGLFEIPWPPPQTTSSRTFRRDEREFASVDAIFERVVPIEEIARVLSVASLQGVVARLHESALAGDDEGVRAEFAKVFRTRLNSVALALEPADKKQMLSALGLSTRQSLGAWVDVLGGTLDEDFAGDPPDADNAFGDGGADDDDDGDYDFDVDYDHPEVIRKLGVQLDDGFLYYFADGNVMRVPNDDDGDDDGELVVTTDVKYEDGFVIFVDGNGDLCRCKSTRRHGLPANAPLVADVLEWLGIDGGRDALAHFCDVRSLKRRRRVEDMEAQLAASYRGNLSALIDDVRREDLAQLLGSKEGVLIGDGWWRLADAHEKSVEELRAIAKEALCHLDTKSLTPGVPPSAADDEGDGDNDEGADGERAQSGEDPAVTQLRERLSEYTGRRSLEVRSLLKKAGLGEFSRLRTDRFQELRALIDAAGYVLCDDGGVPFTADAASPGIDARVRVRPKDATTVTSAAAPIDVAAPPTPASPTPAPPTPAAASPTRADYQASVVATAEVRPMAAAVGATAPVAPRAVSDYEIAVARLRVLTGLAWPERRSSSFWPQQFLQLACDKPLDASQQKLLEMLCEKLAPGTHDAAPAIALLRSSEERGRLAALVDAFELLNDGATNLASKAGELRTQFSL